MKPDIKQLNAIADKRFFSFFVLVLFGISFFLVRLPLLQEPLGFEEGIFADLIVNRPAGPHYSLNGRIDGENIYVYISHPAVPYELLRLGGFICRPFLDDGVYLDDDFITPRLRVVCSLYQFCFGGVLLLFIFFNQSIRGIWPVILVFAAMLSPLSIKTSVHLQIDNTAGVLLCGTAALLFVIAAQTVSNTKKAGIMLFSGGFIAGLGKQEWSLALLAAIILTVLFDRLTSKIATKAGTTNRMSIALWVTTGLIAGNLACCLYDPTNYVKGLHILYRHLNIYDPTSPGWQLSSWLTLMKQRLPFVSVCFIFLIIIFLSLQMNPRRHFLQYLISFYGLLLLIGFVFSDWHSQPRYYCPSFAVLTTTAVSLIPASRPQWYHRTLFTAMVLVFISTVIFVIGFVPDPNPHLEQINSRQLHSSPGTVLYINSGAGWNKPDINYMNNNSPFGKVSEKLRKDYGMILVKPD